MTTRPRANPDRANAAWMKSIEADVDRLLSGHKILSTNLKANDKKVNTASSVIAQTNAQLAETADTIITQASPPGIPTGLSASTVAGYDNLGNPLCYLSASWDAVTTDTSGAAVTISRYEVWVQNSDVSGADYTLVASPFGTSTAGIPLSCNTHYNVKVRALNDAFGIGDFSSPVAVTTLTPSVAALVPSTPTLITSLGSIKAHWDGKLAGGATPPVQYRGVIMQFATSPTGPWSNAGQTLYQSGDSAVTGVTVGTQYWVRFIGFDAAGSTSNPSATATVTVDGVDLADLDADASAAIAAAQSMYPGRFTDNTTLAAYTNHTTTINFPADVFTNPPTAVIVTCGNARFVAGVTSVTNTSALVSVYNSSNGAGVPGECFFVAIGN